MSNCQVASIMNGRLVSFIAIFLIISFEVMGGAEGKPQPHPELRNLPEFRFLTEYLKQLNEFMRFVE